MKLPFILLISSKKILLQMIQKLVVNDSQKVLKVNVGLVRAAILFAHLHFSFGVDNPPSSTFPA